MRDPALRVQVAAFQVRGVPDRGRVDTEGVQGGEVLRGSRGTGRTGQHDAVRDEQEPVRLRRVVVPLKRGVDPAHVEQAVGEERQLGRARDLGRSEQGVPGRFVSAFDCHGFTVIGIQIWPDLVDEPATVLTTPRLRITK